jgi:hypothetical protein
MTMEMLLLKMMNETRMTLATVANEIADRSGNQIEGNSEDKQ